MAQKNAAISQETDMVGISPTGDIEFLSAQTLESFEQIYLNRQHGANPLTDDEKRSIGDPFKPSAPQG